MLYNKQTHTVRLKSNTPHRHWHVEVLKWPMQNKATKTETPWHYWTFTGTYAAFSFSSIFSLCVSTSSYTATVCCCSCTLDVGLDLFFHLLIHTVTITPHRAPVMNATRQQTTAVMAVTAAGDRFLLSEVRKIEDWIILESVLLLSS